MAGSPSAVEDSQFADLVNATLDYFCREKHSPLPCYRRNGTFTCALQPMQAAWAEREKGLEAVPPLEHPQVFALTEAGCDPLRAQMVLAYDGLGLKDISAVVTAHRAQQGQQKVMPSDQSNVCEQCKPGSNTYAWLGSSYSGSCSRVAVNNPQFPAKLGSEEQLLCIGDCGELRFCGPGEFMAVSHVWDHGWQGVREDGLCSRVLSMLLSIASQFGLKWVWLDVAMISGHSELRAESVNAMNRVYTTAGCTIVCDRLLLSMHGGTHRERALAVAISDWMTRVWTMQEALLSKRLLFVQGDCIWSADELIDSLIFADEPATSTNWKAYGAVRTLYPLVSAPTEDLEIMLERIFLLCRDRRTTKTVDLARALFPLFDLKWPGHNTSLAEGQIILLQHLGEQASRCAGLFGPVGLPSPWSWAPMSLVGCSGGLSSLGRSVSERGLTGAWSWKQVQVKQRISRKKGRLMEGTGWKGLLDNVKDSIQGGTAANISDIQSLGKLGFSIANDVHRALKINASAKWPSANSQSDIMAKLTDGKCDIIEFADSNDQQSFSAMVHYSLKDSYPWEGADLYLLSHVGEPVDNECSTDRYDLAVVQSLGPGEYEMRRVGSCVGERIKLASGVKAIRGIFH